jgi:hypothetical protein
LLILPGLSDLCLLRKLIVAQNFFTHNYCHRVAANEKMPARWRAGGKGCHDAGDLSDSASFTLV